MDFTQKLNAAATKNSSLLCVGLDPDISRIPDSLKNSPTPQLDFNKLIIDATHDLVCAYKPNSAFYESKGAEGINDLKLTCEYIRQLYPDLPIILDFKRGDIGNTNQYYAQFAFEYLGVDAITVQPYVGKEALQAFLDYKNKGIFVLCKTSNPGAGELQDLKIDGIRN
jgi:orotidine-5'-phosphate decarboxylase